MKVYEATLIVDDFLYYASREVGGGYIAPYIHNTALLYAINNHVPEINRIASGVKPFYEEDYKFFTIYPTPAYLIEPTTHVKRTFNSVDEAIIFRALEKKIAVPKLIAYMSFPPLTKFRFYTVGGRGTRIIRIGKKLIPARVIYRELKIKKIGEGVFKPSHPVNPMHLKEHKILSAKVYPMPPVPLLLNSTLKGKYILTENNKYIIVPPQSVFSGISFE